MTIDPRIARALLESTKANAAIANMLALVVQKLATLQGDSATTTKLIEQQREVQEALERQIKALNEAVGG